jgi:hypothetical protein
LQPLKPSHELAEPSGWAPLGLPKVQHRKFKVP